VPGSGTYDSSSYVPKESFNMGKVPFGSFSSQQDWERTRKLTHIDDSYLTPGPGQYGGKEIGQKAARKRVNQNHSPRQAGANFGTDVALTRNNSGVRLLAHHGAANANSFVTRLSNSVDEVNP
jgi:hypothetical protein